MDYLERIILPCKIGEFEARKKKRIEKVLTFQPGRFLPRLANFLRQSPFSLPTSGVFPFTGVAKLRSRSKIIMLMYMYLIVF